MILAETLIDLISNGKNIHKIAELGIYRGVVYEFILNRLKNSIFEYWAIDSWTIQVDPTWRKVQEKKWEEMYLKACKGMIKFPQLHVVKTKTIDAAKLFPENYFDLVFIDANHSYEAVMIDIKTWLPLVRKKGILAGHDYGAKKFPGVKLAVNEYFRDTIEILPNTVWVKRT